MRTNSPIFSRSAALRPGPALLCLGLWGACAEEAAPPADEKESFASEAVVGKADWSLDPCTSRGWYGDGECDWFCLSPDPDCDEPQLFAKPSGRVAKYPIVLHHGFAGGHDWIFAWSGVAEALTADGHTVVVTEVPPFDSVAVRTEYLKAAVDDILSRTGAAKVNVIAHSIGGLDSRHLITALGYGDRVASLTTISSPHLGTSAADLGLKVVPGLVDPAVDALAELLGMKISDVAESANVRAALTDLSEANAARFNAEHPNDSRVVYQSWAGVSSLLGLAKYGRDKTLLAACNNRLLLNPGTFDRVRPEFIPLAPVIASGRTGPWHDGLVTVLSSKWGDFKGCIPADHSEEVGQFTKGPPNPSTGFDSASFYRTVVYDLSARGM